MLKKRLTKTKDNCRSQDKLDILLIQLLKSCLTLHTHPDIVKSRAVLFPSFQLCENRKNESNKRKEIVVKSK